MKIDNDREILSYASSKLNIKKFFKCLVIERHVFAIIFLSVIKIDLVFNQIKEENVQILSRVLLTEF